MGVESDERWQIVAPEKQVWPSSDPLSSSDLSYYTLFCKSALPVLLVQ